MEEIRILCAYTKLVPMSELAKLRNPQNTNDHPPEQIDELVEQFKFQGIRHPIIISNRDGLFAAGDGRFQAALKLGMQEFPVDYQDFDTEEQQFAFGVADNETQKWSITNLKKIHLELPKLAPFDIERLGIRDFKFEPDPEAQGDPDACPETPVVAKTKLGELWLLGEHRLLVGDCTVKENVERLMTYYECDCGEVHV